MSPVRVQRRRSKGWKMPSNTLSVTRPGPYGNPFPIRKSVSLSAGVSTEVWTVGTWNGPAMWILDTAAEAAKISVAAFEKWIAAPAQSRLAETVAKDLHGQNLACWCALDQPCHADVLLKLANPEVP